MAMAMGTMGMNSSF